MVNTSRVFGFNAYSLLSRLRGQFLQAFWQSRFVFAGAFALAIVALVTYLPAIRIGYHHSEEHALLLLTHSMSFGQAMLWFFDPRVQLFWYRPIEGLILWVLNAPLGANETIYHLSTIFFHFANALVLWSLLVKVAHNNRVGFLAALLFAASPVYRGSPWWPLDSVPLASFFYLLCISFWIDFLRAKGAGKFIGALFLYFLALFSKETSVTLIVVLFLIDRLLFPREIRFVDLVRRYAGFVAILLLFLIAEFIAQANGQYSNVTGFSLGLQIIPNLIEYLGILAGPWQSTPVSAYWTVISMLLFALAVLKTRSRGLILLAGLTLALLLPVVPTARPEYRYLYMPAMVVSIFMAWLIETALTRYHSNRILRFIGATAIAGFILFGLQQNIAVVQGIADGALPERTLFRTIAQRYPALPDGSLLYFVNPPMPAVNVAGMAFLRFGERVLARSSRDALPAGLSEHPLSLVVYQENQGDLVTLPALGNAVSSTPLVPVRFGIPVELTGYEIANPTVHQGKDLVLLLYWRGLDRIRIDYTVFAHLTDQTGEILDGFDSEPNGGEKPTSSWAPGSMIADWLIFPIQAPPGRNYSIAIGIYDRVTMERVPLIDAEGRAIADEITIGPLEVVP